MSRPPVHRRLRHPLAALVAAALAVVSVGFADGTAVAAPVSGAVAAWGDNMYQQGAVPAGALADVVQVSGGAFGSAALKSDGTVVGWGYPGLGFENPPSSLTDATAVAAGDYFVLALENDGTLTGWGADYDGVVASATAADETGVTAISAGGGYYALALRDDGTVAAWGSTTNGTVAGAAAITDATAVSGGFTAAMALKEDGTVVAWGSNSYGQVDVPVGLSDVTAISAGGTHFMALKSDGTVVAWGDNTSQQTTVPALGPVQAIAAGAYNSAALLDDGSVVVWGDDSYGQVSNAPESTDVSAIAAGFTHFLAVVPAGPAAFTAKATPTIRGTTMVGYVLGARPARVDWAPRPETFGYQWLRDDVAIDGATGPKYRLAAADDGAAITVRVTANRTGYTSEAMVSAPTAPITTRTFVTTTPTITGTPAVGRVLTGKTTVWTPKIQSRTFAWTRNGVVIDGATDSKYTLTAADSGRTIRFVVTGYRTDYVTATVRSEGRKIR
jgi:hypothetical protein